MAWGRSRCADFGISCAFLGTVCAAPASLCGATCFGFPVHCGLENLAIVHKTDWYDMGSILRIQRCKARNPGLLQFHLDRVRNRL
jgi:hypothetical protein